MHAFIKHTRHVSICGRSSLFNINFGACKFLSGFVPPHEAVQQDDVDRLQEFVQASKQLFVLTGAGLSTESGIPDYRSEGVGLFSRSSNRPVQFKDFMTSRSTRRRYWARNYVAWPRFSSSKPNVCHFCLKEWEKNGLLSVNVTQNVDRLHFKAGMNKVIELHGTTYRVRCMSCEYITTRYNFQDVLKQLNPDINLKAIEIRPDGDVDLDPELIKDFKIPSCTKCDGILKPDVVFFGENVPRSRVNKTEAKLLESDALLVLGSSMEVLSSYRFVLAAHEQNKPVAIVNIGKTRADKLASLKLNVCCGDILPRIIIN